MKVNLLAFISLALSTSRVKWKQFRNFSARKGHLRDTFLCYFANSSYCGENQLLELRTEIHFYLGRRRRRNVEKIERNRGRNAAWAGLTGPTEKKNNNNENSVNIATTAYFTTYPHIFFFCCYSGCEWKVLVSAQKQFFPIDFRMLPSS